MAMRTLAATLSSLAFVVSLGADEPPAPATSGALEQFLATGSHHAVQDYRALRRLEAVNDKFGKQGWIEAWTELTPGGFRYEIVAEGGSSYVRGKVLEAALKNEQRLFEKGDLARADLTVRNYEFLAANQIQDDGLVRVALKPRREDQVLIAGAMWLNAGTGDLIRIEGTLARSPSFWTRRVEIVREYDRIGGVRVPVRVESTAQVKIAGVSHFVMTYDYERINGKLVGAPASSARR
jgi:hypothetical protein